MARQFAFKKEKSDNAPECFLEVYREYSTSLQGIPIMRYSHGNYVFGANILFPGYSILAFIIFFCKIVYDANI